MIREKYLWKWSVTIFWNVLIDGNFREFDELEKFVDETRILSGLEVPWRKYCNKKKRVERRVNADNCFRPFVADTLDIVIELEVSFIAREWKFLSEEKKMNRSVQRDGRQWIRKVLDVRAISPFL